MADGFRLKAVLGETAAAGEAVYTTTMKNSSFTTTNGWRVIGSGRVYSMPGRNRTRAEVNSIFGKSPLGESAEV